MFSSQHVMICKSVQACLCVMKCVVYMHVCQGTNTLKNVMCMHINQWCHWVPIKYARLWWSAAFSTPSAQNQSARYTHPIRWHSNKSACCPPSRTLWSPCCIDAALPPASRQTHTGRRNAAIQPWSYTGAGRERTVSFSATFQIRTRV